jgi:Polyketide cyclase / dehydrase and lipid transport
MARVFVKEESVIDAHPDIVFAALADYQEQRPRILTPNFLDYTVEKGGHGSGTVVSYRLKSANRERPYKLRIDEAVKGQILTERDSNSSLVTTWTVIPVNNGQRSRVRVTTEWEGTTGIKGFFERTFAPLGLRRIYRSMLESLASQLSNASDGQVTAVRGKKSSSGTNLRGLLLILGVVIGFAVSAKYLRKPQNDQ